MKILAIGDVNVDVILRSGPPPKGKQVVIDDFDVYGGGCATNFALACAKLGAEVKLIGRVGDDHWGSFILEKLKRGGVNVRDVAAAKGKKTGVTFALVEGLERSFVSRRGENAALSARDVKIKRFDFDLLHIPSFFLLESLQPDYPKIMRKAKEKRVLVSFDTGWDPFGRWGKNSPLLDAIREANIFLPNLDEARMILEAPKASDKELAKTLLGMGLKAVAIKEGAKGSFVADREKSARIPPFKANVVDTTGAGDVFNAGFLLAYMKTNDVVRAGRFGNAAAAISVTGPGWERYPTNAEVNALLRSSGFEPLLF